MTQWRSDPKFIGNTPLLEFEKPEKEYEYIRALECVISRQVRSLEDLRNYLLRKEWKELWTDSKETAYMKFVAGVPNCIYVPHDASSDDALARVYRRDTVRKLAEIGICDFVFKESREIKHKTSMMF